LQNRKWVVGKYIIDTEKIRNGFGIKWRVFGCFVMEKRGESMETHSEGKDGDPRDHQKHNHGDDDDDDDVDDGRVSQKENGDKGATNHIFWTQGPKVKGGQKIALPAETQVTGSS
jgi:ABC-type Zn2+ transport system substrate-binding protein/surface adhesin